MTIKGGKIVTEWNVDASKMDSALAQAEAKVKKAGSEHQKAANAATSAYKKTRKSVKDLGDSLEKAGGRSRASAGKIAQYAAMATLAAKATSTLQNALIETFKESARFSTAAQNYTGNLEEAKKATLGLVSSLDLMEAKNRLVGLSVQLTDNEFVSLASASQKMATVMGIDAKSAMESLSIALGRQSRLVADNLGIIMDAEGAQKRYAASIGKTVSELTEYERKQAWQIEFMDKLKQKAETYYVDTAKVSTQMKKLWTAIGDAAVATFAEIDKNIVKSLARYSTYFKGVMEEAEKARFNAENSTERQLELKYEVPTASPLFEAAQNELNRGTANFRSDNFLSAQIAIIDARVQEINEKKIKAQNDAKNIEEQIKNSINSRISAIETLLNKEGEIDSAINRHNIAVTLNNDLEKASPLGAYFKGMIDTREKVNEALRADLEFLKKAKEGTEIIDGTLARQNESIQIGISNLAQAESEIDDLLNEYKKLQTIAKKNKQEAEEAGKAAEAERDRQARARKAAERKRREEREIDALINANPERDVQSLAKATTEELFGVEERIRREKEREKIRAIKAHNKEVAKVLKQAHKEIEKEIEEHNNRFFKLPKEQATWEGAWTDNINQIKGAFADFGAGILGAAVAAKQGSITFSEAMQDMTASILVNLAQQATVKALMATAEGLFALFYAPPAAAGYFAAAAAFGAVAAAAGAGGLALTRNTSKANEAKKEPIRRETTFGKKGSTSDQDIYVNVYFGQPSSPLASIIASSSVTRTVEGRA